LMLKRRPQFGVFQVGVHPGERAGHGLILLFPSRPGSGRGNSIFRSLRLYIHRAREKL
jgi:hypothetical protein